jgi:hypothetical protein
MIRTLARDQLAAMQRVPAGDPAAWRLVYRDGRANLHVASFAHGLFYARDSLDAALGDVVDVQLAGERVTAIRPVS